MMTRMELPLSAIAASAGLGALVGLIRQWSEQTKHHDQPDLDFGGVRTHTFWGLLGCLSGAASPTVPWALPTVILVIAAHQIVSRWKSSDTAVKLGGTGFAAMLVTLLVGALVAWGNTQAAALITMLAIVVLGLKQPIHEWTRRFTPEDVRAALQFVAITGVILPLVPNRPMGPFDGFNPYSTWLMVVLISGIGFAGYVAMRLLGTKSGIVVTSLLGGLASSTASTLAFSRQSREEPALSLTFAFAISTACTVMIPRVVAVIAVLNPALAWAVGVPLGLMMLPAILFGLWYTLQKSTNGNQVASPAMANPLSLRTSIKFALLYALFAFLVKAATQLDLQSGLLPLAFVSGLTDMDAIALSMADTQRDGSILLGLAADAIVVGAVANSLLKGGMAVALGSPALRKPVAMVLGATALVGAIAVIAF